MLLLPGKRGAKYKTRRCDLEVENLVLEAREKGCNKYEIHNILKAKLGYKAPSPSGIYNILRRNNKNLLTLKDARNKENDYQGEGRLGHVDCHYLSKDTIKGDKKRYYLVCVIDSCTRIAWAEVIEDIQSLTVMFATLRCLNYIASDHDIKFAEMLTYNGAEFGLRVSNAL